MDADVLSDERHGGGQRNRVVLAPQRLALMPTMREAHRGGRWQSARFTEEITYKQ